MLPAIPRTAPFRQEKEAVGLPMRAIPSRRSLGRGDEHCNLIKPRRREMRIGVGLFYQAIPSPLATTTNPLEDSLFTHQMNPGRRNTISQQSPKQAFPARTSPRSKTTLPRNGNGGAVKAPKWAQSNFYDGDDDDDTYPTPDSANERLPLLPRDMNRYSTRRVKGISRYRVVSAKQQAQIEANYERRRSGRYRPPSAPSQSSSKCWPGLAGTAILVSALLVLAMLTIGFVFQTSRSLENVKVRNVTNIVVSQEELVMGVLLEAGNPNLFPVVVGDHLSVDIFARSEHFDDLPSRTASRRGQPLPWMRWPPWGGHDDDDDEGDKPPHNVTEGTSLLLGTVLALEAPLTFPSTTFTRVPITSQRGEMKLVNPAVNATNGTEKWKKCILYNFELIVRGTIKYQAPIGGRERAVGIDWRGTVDPLHNRVFGED